MITGMERELSEVGLAAAIQAFDAAFPARHTMPTSYAEKRAAVGNAIRGYLEAMGEKTLSPEVDKKGYEAAMRRVAETIDVMGLRDSTRTLSVADYVLMVIKAYLEKAATPAPVRESVMDEAIRRGEEIAGRPAEGRAVKISRPLEEEIAENLVEHALREGDAKVTARAIKDRHPILSFFDYDHLEEPMRDVASCFYSVALTLVAIPGKNPAELNVALRKLLEAKDAAVRSVL
jgi:hypothetical protein